MRKSIYFLSPLLLVVFLTGCSVFGIATKGDLKRQGEANQQEMASLQQSVDGRVNSMQQTVDNDLARVTGALQAMEKELNTTIAELDGRTEANASELADIQVHFEIIQGQVQLALADLQTVAAAASRAEADSKQAVQLQHDTQLSERARLRDRLEELEVQIASWLPATTPIQELPPTLQSEVPLQNAAVSTRSESVPPPGLQIPESARQGNNR